MSERAGSGVAAAAAVAASEKRRQQLQRWKGSCTDLEAGEPRWRARPGAGARAGAPRRVRFEAAAEFLAACASGDALDAEEMLGGGADVDCANTDGISALHQACIDENLEMVEFLLRQNANVDQSDNEGWTPLHVAVSCGYSEIVECLINHAASIAAVNSDGQLPIDLAEENYMENLLQAEITKQGIDVESARREEEDLLLQHARQWLNSGKIEDISHPKTGANALHVAAAKGYIEVMRLLLQAGFSVAARDKDGWTPLHAAAHWGMEDSCKLLVEHFCDMEAVNNSGQTPFDVADEDILSLLEDLQKKQDDLRTEKEEKMKRAIIETSTQPQQPSTKPRKSSVCRMSSREKISVQDLSKERKTLETLSLDESKKEESSSSSSETEDVSDSDSECETEKKRSSLNDASNVNGTEVLPRVPAVTLAPSGLKYSGPSAKHLVNQDAPPAWQTELRKTSSFVALQDAQITSDKTPLTSIRRSASTPRLGAQWKGKDVAEPRLARVPPTPIGRSLSVPETCAEQLVSSTYQKVKDPNCQQGETTTPTSNVDFKERRKLYLTPVRDEESESQRKARSRHARQSRRSTQGVTLTDLKEAEKTLGISTEKKTQEQLERREEVKENEGKKERSSLSEDKDAASRLRPVTTGVGNSGSALAPTHSRHSTPTVSFQDADTGAELESDRREEGDADYNSRNRLSVRDRRKARKERRFTGKADSTEEEDGTEQMNSLDTPTHSSLPADQMGDWIESRVGIHSLHSTGARADSNGDFRKMYEMVLSENVRLKEQLRDAQYYLSQANRELERVMKRQQRGDQPARLELERFERRAFERRTAELEERLKILTDLKVDNQRLKDENAALIRVISRLSK
ncbi:protein phosphatase 1 regulatory subunit 12C isoform X2 [Amblyraja radiata]|uniref:protein phosphatase 1 regulatory subunit 12C isoform X2 n=1 Tax=Amblyraja radiata TaxID=386614 RepID=UPI001402D47C|nr:protein phosphatase 1 regulatory subunit 12C isoform X2 [Amblyraja radiata]